MPSHFYPHFVESQKNEIKIKNLLPKSLFPLDYFIFYSLIYPKIMRVSLPFHFHSLVFLYIFLLVIYFIFSLNSFSYINYFCILYFSIFIHHLIFLFYFPYHNNHAIIICWLVKVLACFFLLWKSFLKWKESPPCKCPHTLEYIRSRYDVLRAHLWSYQEIPPMGTYTKTFKKCKKYMLLPNFVRLLTLRIWIGHQETKVRS